MTPALQNEVEQVLAGVGEQYQPRAATAIAMNPNTGAILALANWPRVNANDPNAVRSVDDRDHAVADSYEPGSTFKAITVAGALQDGVVTPSTPFDIPPGAPGRRPPDLTTPSPTATRRSPPPRSSRSPATSART